MKKITFILLFLFFCLSGAVGQAVIRISSRDGSGNTSSLRMDSDVKKKTLDTAYMECFYDYSYLRDTIDENAKRREDMMVLQIGSRGSKFYTHRERIVDSLIRTSSPEEMLANPQKFRGGETWTVYKDYPSEKLTYTDKIVRDNFLYEEELFIQDWKVSDETKTIAGYACTKATCSFRGRNYTAWFTMEIPVSNGPWKFSGLPGLILEAGDDQGHYAFTLNGIREVSVPIEMPEHQYLKADRQKYLETLEKFNVNPVGYINESMSAAGSNPNVKSGITIRSSDGRSTEELTGPQEVKFDFMERDYKAGDYKKGKKRK